MKRYRVDLTPLAESDIAAAFHYIHRRAPLNAERWIRGIYAAVDSLMRQPKRCPRAPESDYLGEELRHLVFKSHRIIFRVEETRKIVQVLHVRHGAQRAVGEPYDSPGE